MKIPEYIEQIWGKWKQKGNGKEMTPKEKWMLLLLSGLLLAVIIFPAGKKEDSSLSTALDVQQEENGSYQNIYSGGSTELNQYERYLSEQLEQILSQIDGAGAVEAWVTLSGSSEVVLFEEKDQNTTNLEEADSVGGTRQEESSQTDKTVVTDSSGNPYIIKTLQPEVEGVLVVAEGAGDSVVKKNISEAAQVLFGIDAHRIKVAKKKVEE